MAMRRVLSLALLLFAAGGLAIALAAQALLDRCQRRSWACPRGRWWTIRPRPWRDFSPLRARRLPLSCRGRRDGSWGGVDPLSLAQRPLSRASCALAAIPGPEHWRPILAWFEQEALSHGARNLWVCASSFNPGALRFYERHGFPPAATLPGLVADGYDEILRRKFPIAAGDQL
jgi:hypothetical protein